MTPGKNAFHRALAPLREIPVNEANLIATRHNILRFKDSMDESGKTSEEELQKKAVTIMRILDIICLILAFF